MPLLLVPLSWALSSVGLSLTYTGAAAGAAAVSSWAVTTGSGIFLVGAGTALKAFAVGGIAAVLNIIY